jgi:hypothetical protein
MSAQHSPQQAEQSSVFAEDAELLEYERSQFQHGIRRARNTLFIAGGIMFAVDMIMLLVQLNEMGDAEINYAYLYGLVAFDTLLLAAFIGLGLWTRRKPYAAMLTGLILFCTVQMIAMVFDPTNIYKGILVKMVVIVTLVAGLKKAKALQQLDNFSAGRY